MNGFGSFLVFIVLVSIIPIISWASVGLELATALDMAICYFIALICYSIVFRFSSALFLLDDSFLSLSGIDLIISSLIPRRAVSFKIDKEVWMASSTFKIGATSSTKVTGSSTIV
jgi:hypothetical protein